MGYLQHFDHDVFVSYSHGFQGAEASPPLRDWTLDLIRELETEIKNVNPEFDGLDIWRDEDMDPTVHMTEELRGHVTRSCILMIVMSPRYLLSDWCKDEREWFKQEVENREDRQRGLVFVVRAIKTDEKNWPDFLRDVRGHPLLGFQFHDRREDTPYGWRLGGRKGEAYAKELNKLQNKLTMRLRELCDAETRRAMAELPKIVTPSPGPRRIYLHARPEHAAICNEVARTLSQDGIALKTVASPAPNLLDMNRQSHERIATAKSCDAMALLHCADDSEQQFINDLQQIGYYERGRVEAERGAPLPCAVLDQSGHMSESPYVGIERFDLARNDWFGKFRGWLERAGQQAIAIA